MIYNLLFIIYSIKIRLMFTVAYINYHLHFYRYNFSNKTIYIILYSFTLNYISRYMNVKINENKIKKTVYKVFFMLPSFFKIKI